MQKNLKRTKTQIHDRHNNKRIQKMESINNNLTVRKTSTHIQSHNQNTRKRRRQKLPKSGKNNRNTNQYNKPGDKRKPLV